MRNRILVIDDSQLALDAIADVLDKGGFDVRVSTDVSHLSTAFGDWHPDL